MMRKNIFVLSIGLFFAFICGSWYYGVLNTWTQESYVSDVLNDLGAEDKNYIADPSDTEIAKGKDLIFKGYTTDENGRSSRQISKFYKCTSCHNVNREDPDLTRVDQSARLEYAKKNNIPYLQGSTFWGIANRETYYNDDYVKKYGDLVINAKNSLEGSIQLCAKVCSQGRELKPWEMEAILAYYKTISMKVSDLDFSKEEWNIILQGKLSNDEKIMRIKSKYMVKSPATFADPPVNKKDGYGMVGNPDNGKDLYEISCQHCHRINGESDVILGNDRLTFKWLKKNIKKDSELSLYEIIRHGTYSELGHKEYMPLYTKEKMSDQQIEDLRAYIEKMSKSKEH